MGKTIAFRKATEAVHHMADPAPPWNDILATARDLVGADAGTLMMFDHSEQLLMLQQVGIDPAAELEYRQHFYKEDTVAKAAVARPAGIWLDSTQILPAKVMQKMPFMPTTSQGATSDRFWLLSFTKMRSSKQHSAFNVSLRGPMRSSR